MTTRPGGRRGRRIGLALAGGGPAGAVYEIGALRALEEAIDGLDLTACDVYVGVSAGAFVAAWLANGHGPAALARALVSDGPGDLPFNPAGFFTPAYREWGRRAARLPGLVADALWQATRPRSQQSLLGSLTRLSRALPLGLFDNEPIRRSLARAFAHPGRTDDFRRLKHRLFVVSADLEAGTPILFGSPGLDHVPISTAVQASTAVPGLYPPVEVGGKLCVDGVLLRTVHASVALEHGAGLVLCVNPLVPVDVASGVRRGELRPGVLKRGGLPALLSQTFRTLIHSRMVVGMARYRTHFPGADVVLLEPARDDYDILFGSIFSFASRRRVCTLAYRSTLQHLRRRARELAPLLKRHGLRLRLDVVEDETRDLWKGLGLHPEATPHPVTARLAGTLAVLEGRSRRTETRRSRSATVSSALRTPPRRPR